MFRRVWQTGIPEHYPVTQYKDNRLQGWYENFVYRLPTGEIVAVFDNLTVKKQAEIGLKESEERYRRLLASVSGYVYSVEVRDGIPFHTVHGSGCEAITGYTSDEYERDPNLWMTMVIQEDRALVEEQAEHILVSADPVTMEHRIIHKNGSIRWIRNTLVPHIDAQGTLISYDGIVSDISERILAQQELSDAEEKFRSLAEQSTEGILLTDQNMKIIEWNMTQEQIFGFSRDEIVGLALWDFQHLVLPEEMKKEISPQLMRARMQQLIDTQGPLWSPSVMEYSIHTGQGEEKLVQVTAFPIKRREGIMYCAITRDITAARKAELQIHESEQRFRQFADNIDEVFGIFDMASQRALYVSAAYEKIWGRKTDALYQNTRIWIEAVLPEDREIVIKGSLSSPEPANIEFRISRPDGQVRWIRFRTFPIRNKQGIVFRIAGIAADITEFKKAAQQAQLHQQQLIMADKMASLGVLVSGVAHEINNPNNFIMLNAPILRDAWLDAQKILDAHYKEKGDFPIAQMNYSEMAANIVPLLDGIQRGAESIQRIVSNLKDYTRQDAYDQQSEVDANAIVNSAVSLLKNMVKKSTKNFTFNLHPEPLLLQGNFQRLGQVVVNLIQNACDALTDQAQGIQVSTGRVAATDAVSIVVRDEGVGIEPEFISKVTDPFFFFTTKRDTGGTGLGLSISAGIVKDHGGEIRFESTPGKGTTVTVTLPGKGSSMGEHDGREKNHNRG